MARIHALLTQGYKVTCAVVAAELETNARTIFRDIEVMRDQLGLPITYDRRKHSLAYTGPVTSTLFGALQTEEVL